MQRTGPVKILKGGRGIAHRYREGIVEVFREAFAGPPYFEGPEEAARFSGRLVAHARQLGFRICLALDPGQRLVLGFAYGYTVPPDSWWWETLAGDTPARRLYDRRGWIMLAAGVRFPGVDKPYVLMGKDLGPSQPAYPAGPTRDSRV